MNSLDALHSHTSQDLLATCELEINAQIAKASNKRLLDLMQYHLKAGGSRTRSKLAIHSGLAMGLPTRDCVAIANTCELLHNASLLLDDIQDGDTYRRGRAAAWQIFDANTAMCAASFMLSAAYASIAHVQNAKGELVTHTHTRTAELISGQTDDLTHDKNSTTVNTYLNIAKLKSGSLLSLPLELVMLASRQPFLVDVARTAGESFAVAYQIADDLNDCAEDLEKGSCNIIQILEATGLDRAQALDQAKFLAFNHLDKAIEQSGRLPSNSGHAIYEMSMKLGVALSIQSSKACEPA
jgi:geranylgeranyl diphosphate synthase type II